MTVKIRLRNEGKVRSVGYQTTQWICRVPPNVTDPLSFAELFVIRETEGLEALDRIATLTDFENLPINELSFFDIRFSGGELANSVLPDDILTITTPLSFWLQDTAPYQDQVFIVDSVQSLASGIMPKILTQNRLQLPGYSFKNRDLGRWFSLSGFATGAYNTRVKILSFEGNTAIIDLPTATNETGGNWDTKRLKIKTLVNPAQEKRYFPTIVGPVNWAITRGVLLVASGNAGYTMREHPEVSLFRDVRITTIEPSLESGVAKFAACKANIEQLQKDANGSHR